MAKTILNVFSSGSKNFAWPMPKIQSVDKLAFTSYEFLAPILVAQLRKFHEKEVPILEIARKIKYPSLAARYLHLSLPKEFTSNSKADLCSIYENTFDICSALQEDVLCAKTGQNILKGFDVESLDSQWIKLEGKDVRQTLGQLKGSLFSWSEMLYGVFHNIGHEFHGVYPLNARENFLVSEYHNLSQGKFNSKHQKITILECLPKEVSVKVDMHNRIYSSFPLAASSTRVAVICDSKNCCAEDLLKLLDETKKDLLRAASTVEIASEEEVREYYAQSMFCLLSPLGRFKLPKKELCEKLKSGFEGEEKRYFDATNTMKLTAKNVNLCFNPLVSKEEFFGAVEF